MESSNEEFVPIDNLEDLKRDVTMSGFDHHFDKEIEEKVKNGDKEFTLGTQAEVDGDEMEYTLHVRIDAEKRKGYLNDLDAVFTDKQTGEQRSHTFPRYLRVTAKEAFNLLKWGEDTAVQKRLFNKQGERYLSYITLQTSQPKVDGNYPLKQYHEHYYKEKPFLLENALQELVVPVKELNDLPKLVSSLKRGNVHSVTIFHNNQEQQGFLSVNGKTGEIEVRDAAMKVIPKEPKQQQEATLKEVTVQETEAVKKKSGPSQSISWKQTTTSNKGLSHTG